MTMLPIKKIVCPTDFSDPAHEGLKAATELAEHFQAELMVVNVVSPIGFHLPTVMEEMQTAAEKSMTDLISKRVPKAVQTRSIVIQGKPADEIVKLADEKDADLIVIATHGESGWQRFLFGSVTEKVVRMTSCPVLTVHQPQDK